jgi:hypothetical protein
MALSWYLPDPAGHEIRCISGDPHDTEHVEDLGLSCRSRTVGRGDIFPIANIKVDQSGVLLRTQQSFSVHHENNDRTTGGLSMPKVYWR